MGSARKLRRKAWQRSTEPSWHFWCRRQGAQPQRRVLVHATAQGYSLHATAVERSAPQARATGYPGAWSMPTAEELIADMNEDIRKSLKGEI